MRWILCTIAALWMSCATLAFAGLPESASTPQDAVSRAADTVRDVAANRRLILLGELHGTREVPRLASMLIERYSGREPVVVAVEIDHREQRAIDAYIASDGGASSRAALIARPFWTRHDVQHDGRRNHDLIDLFDSIRRLERSGRDVAVLAFDVPRMRDHHQRDRGMATVLRAASGALPRGRLIVVTGNVHAMLERPRSAPPLMQTPVGAYLRDLDPVSFRITAREGAFWMCRARCGPAAADGRGMRTGPATGAYHHVIVLPRHHVARLIGASP